MATEQRFVPSLMISDLRGWISGEEDGDQAGLPYFTRASDEAGVNETRHARNRVVDLIRTRMYNSLPMLTGRGGGYAPRPYADVARVSYEHYAGYAHGVSADSARDAYELYADVERVPYELNAGYARELCADLFRDAYELYCADLVTGRGGGYVGPYTDSVIGRRGGDAGSVSGHRGGDSVNEGDALGVGVQLNDDMLRAQFSAAGARGYGRSEVALNDQTGGCFNVTINVTNNPPQVSPTTEQDDPEGLAQRVLQSAFGGIVPFCYTMLNETLNETFKDSYPGYIKAASYSGFGLITTFTFIGIISKKRAKDAVRVVASSCTAALTIAIVNIVSENVYVKYTCGIIGTMATFATMAIKW